MDSSATEAATTAIAPTVTTGIREMENPEDIPNESQVDREIQELNRLLEVIKTGEEEG